MPQPPTQAPVPLGNPSYPPSPGGQPQHPVGSSSVPSQLPVPNHSLAGGGANYTPQPYAGQTTYSPPPNNVTISDPINSSVRQQPAYVSEETSAFIPTPLASHKPALYIQLGTLSSEEGAKQELSRLRKRYYREIGDLAGSVRSFEGPDGKKIFRALIGPFKTRNIALSKCNKLGSTCRVVQIP